MTDERPKDHNDVFIDHFVATLDELIEAEAAHKFLVPLLQGETDPTKYPAPVRKMLTSICVDSVWEHGEDFACDNLHDVVFTNLLDSSALGVPVIGENSQFLDGDEIDTRQCAWREAIAMQASFALVTMLEDRREEILNTPKKRRAAQ